MEILLWIFIVIVFYSYAGYGIILIINKKAAFLQRIFHKPFNSIASEIISEPNEYRPKVTLIISASGENRSIIREKIANTNELNYPRDNFEVIFEIAYDKNSETDETIEEYYNSMGSGFDFTKFTSKDQEVYVKFLDMDKEETGVRDSEILENLSKVLQSDLFSTDEITEGAKEKLDEINQAGSGKELIIRVTKDIERKGKISQVNRTVNRAEGQIIVFSDANTMFNEEAIVNIVRHFADKRVGCVAGEKRVKKGVNSTSGEGEGLYWKYESLLKKLDSDLYTTVGAAGEIFAVRKELFQEGIDPNALIEDFVVSMKIAQKGYRVIYEPEAYAEEEPTFDLKSEFIRRRRIAAGGFQAIVWLRELLNPIKYGVLSFQYISHRVLRWAVVPFLLPLILLLNILLIPQGAVYGLLFAIQVIFYLLAFVGYFLELKKRKIKIFYFPFLLMMMNAAAYSGIKRYLKGEQQVVWEKVKR